MKLAGKVAIITGAASGIGRASAVAFAGEGTKVVVVDVNRQHGEETVEQIREKGGQGAWSKDANRRTRTAKVYSAGRAVAR